MKRTIVLSAGHHRNDPGAIALGAKEADLTMKFRDALATKLRNMGYRVVTPNDSLTLKESIKEARQFCGTLCLELHFNAFNGEAHGVEAFHRRGDLIGHQVAKALTRDTARALGLKDRGAKVPAQSHRRRLAWVDDLGHGVLLEIAFMDNKSDMSKLDEPSEVDRWATCCAAAIDHTYK